MIEPGKDEIHTNGTVYTRESNGTGYFVGIIVALALLAIAYLVFSLNSQPSTTPTSPPPDQNLYQDLGGSKVLGIAAHRLVLKKADGDCLMIGADFGYEQVPCPLPITGPSIDSTSSSAPAVAAPTPVPVGDSTSSIVDPSASKG